MDEFFLNTEEQETIYKAMVFYYEHPEYNDDAHNNTVVEMIEAFRPAGVEKLTCPYCDTVIPDHAETCIVIESEIVDEKPRTECRICGKTGPECWH